MDVTRGEIYFANLGGNIGSEQGGIRPVLIVQNNKGNKYSSTTLVAPLTKCLKKRSLPTQVYLDKREHKLRENSVVMLEQIKTICKSKLGQRLTKLDEDKMLEIDNAIIISAGLDRYEIVVKYFEQIMEFVEDAECSEEVKLESIKLLQLLCTPGDKAG